MGVGTLQSGFRGATRKGDLTAQNEEERGGGERAKTGKITQQGK